jgi:hypothetical protein
MKLMKSALLASAAIVLMSGSAMAFTGSATAYVAVPVAITGASPMDFGKVANTGGGDTVISTSSQIISNGKLIGGTISPATVTVTGESYNTYAITYGTFAMNNTNLKLVADTSNPSSGQLNNGAGTFAVNAYLTIPAAQTAGTYTGSYVVNVAYN